MLKRLRRFIHRLIVWWRAWRLRKSDSKRAPRHPPLLDENVQFTVYRPRGIQPQRWYPLLAFAHLSERPLNAPADEPDPIEEVERQAQQILGEQTAAYQDLTQDSTQPIPREGEITLVPEITGVEINPVRRSFRWQEAVHREEFRLRASAEMGGRVARGRMSAFLGSILVAEVPLSVRVGAVEAYPGRATALEQSSARVYRRIFASYSHKDESVVRELERYARALGDEYIRDLIHLRTGEVWDARLKEMIDQADVFQLFWSWHSMESSFVEQEWRYALSTGRPHFLRPVYWQQPLPAQPERNLPPPELMKLHFHNLHLPPPTVDPGLAPGRVKTVFASSGKEHRFQELFLQERQQQLQYEADLGRPARNEDLLQAMRKNQAEMRELYDAMPAAGWFADQEQVFTSMQGRLERRRAEVVKRLKAVRDSAAPLELDFTTPQVQARSIAPRPARHHRKMPAHHLIFFRLRSPRAGYLSVFNLGTTGDTLLLYPNAWQPEGRILADSFHDLPDDPAYEFGHLEGTPLGLEVVLALVTPEPLSAYAPLPLPQNGFVVWKGVRIFDELLPRLEKLPAHSWCLGEMSFEIVSG